MTTRPNFPPDLEDQQANLPAIVDEQHQMMLEKAMAYKTLNTTPDKMSRTLTILQKNLGGQRLGVYDLPRLTLPPQGYEAWVLPSTGESVYEKSIEGIIIDIAFPRAYWKNQIQEGRTPPNCSSPDGIKGFGLPSGNCDTCEYNKWGTALSGNKTGKACREQRLLFFLRPDNLFPLVVQVPPTSLDVVKDYCISLSNEDRLYSEVFTSLSLTKVDNGSNPYSKIVMTKSGDVPEEIRGMLENFIEGFMPLITTPTYTPENTQVDPNPAVSDTEKEFEGQTVVDGSATGVPDDEPANDSPQTAQATFLGDDPEDEQTPNNVPDLPF